MKDHNDTRQSPLLEVRGLQTYFHTEEGVVRAVDSVDFTIEREKILGVVGESGCGKSVTGLSIIGLIPKPAGRIEGGEILYHRVGTCIDLAKLDPMGREIRSIRGKEIAMIFQDPMTSLNPVYTVGNQICETIRLHESVGQKEAREKALEALNAVGLPSPQRNFSEYPHQLSGGMRQRVMIAIALSCRPSLLIADEPTTALDVTIQAQVLRLMESISERFKMSILFITHNLGVVAKMADDVVVMYFGKIVEGAPVRGIFHHPKHPYTQGLIKSIPSLTSRRSQRLTPIQGVVPDPLARPKGCGFVTRCGHAGELCQIEPPPLIEVDSGHFVSCWMWN